MKNSKLRSLFLILISILSMNTLISFALPDEDPLKNNFTFVWGGSDHENLKGMRSSSQNIFYIAGETDSIDPDGDIYLLKLNTTELKAGNPFPDWLRVYGGNNAEIFGDMIVDSSGNVYIAGSTYSYGSGSYDLFLLKYNDAGTLEWNITWGTIWWEVTGDYYEYSNANCLAIDSMNNIYVVGIFEYLDVLLVKYNSLGEYQWNRTWNILPAYGGWDPSEDTPLDIKIDSNDNIYVAVRAEGSYYGDHSAILKCNTEGVLLWNTTFPPSTSYRGANLLLNSNGIFFCSSFFLAKFDPNIGNHLWNISIWQSNRFNAMKFDSSGNIIILCTAGWLSGNGVIVEKFGLDGMLYWNKTFPSHPSYSCDSRDIYIDTEGNIFALASAMADVLILKYDTVGELQYNYFWGSPEVDLPARIFVDSDENIYVSGITTGFGGEGDYNVFFAGFSKRIRSEPAIFGYNFFLLLGILSIISIYTIRKIEKN
ncbi:MAG: SBBP repeat-containing protein [Promethearchaeota archaeon]